MCVKALSKSGAATDSRYCVEFFTLFCCRPDGAVTPVRGIAAAAAACGGCWVGRGLGWRERRVARRVAVGTAEQQRNEARRRARVVAWH